MDRTPDMQALVERSSCFSVLLLSRDQKWSDEGTHHTIHDSVLRPLLSIANECWAYGMDESSETFLAARAILHKEGRRHRVLLSGDPVTGYERFWNAHGGKRGSIALAVPFESLQPDAIFTHCRRCFLLTNYRAAHSSAAISYAQRKVQDQRHLVICLPRNNGLEWLDVFAPKPLAFSLFTKARVLCHETET